MPDFQTIHTRYGLSRMAEAEATGAPINLVAMAIGDGNGNPVWEVHDTQTDLLRERYRAAPNRIYQDPERDTRFVAELVIPVSVGGFTIRELGLFDEFGGLFVVGNLPDTYKPQAGDGAFADTIIRVEFLVSNSEIVTLQVDPNVAVATHSWVINNVSMGTLVPGGTTGQVLSKRSNADGDAEWADPDAASVNVDTIEERQTLAAGQLIIDMAITTTRGLAVYINGERIYRGPAANEWEPDPLYPGTSIVLGQAWAAGDQVLLVQNDPAGIASPPLERDQNLADVPNKGLARTNLGVYSREEADQLAPAGLVAHFARNSAPAGWLKANGALVSRTAYPRLFAAIGTLFGAGDGFNTFRVPDLRGEFLRGWDDGKGTDPGRVLGSHQTSQVQRHKHVTPWGEQWSWNPPWGRTNTGSRTGSARTDNDNHWSHTNDGSDYDGAVNTAGVIGDETRPRNIALLACIRY